MKLIKGIQSSFKPLFLLFMMCLLFAAYGDQALGLGENEQCQTLPADATIRRGYSQTVISPNRYHHPTCWNGYIVDLDDVNFFTGLGRFGEVISFSDNSKRPTDEQTCESLELNVFAWEKTDTEPLFIDHYSSKGSWVILFGHGVCMMPGISLVREGFIGDDQILEEGKSYRFAVRAQINNPDGKYFWHPVKVTCRAGRASLVK
jgi:hypothetical protein